MTDETVDVRGYARGCERMSAPGSAARIAGRRPPMALRVPALLAAGCLALGLSSAHAAEPLVDADWLHANLERADLVVLDVRNEIDGGSAETYAEGHVPGSIYSDYMKDGWRVARGSAPPSNDRQGDVAGAVRPGDSFSAEIARGKR